jgi:hypothetical protein
VATLAALAEPDVLPAEAVAVGTAVGTSENGPGEPGPSVVDLPGAGDRTRTGDVQLGKLAFYQLNYARDVLTPTPKTTPQLDVPSTAARAITPSGTGRRGRYR